MDFDACRFDFRIDNKNGLTPSRRKRAFKRSVYSTLFKCKICGLLFDSRPALLDHKTQHSEYPCTYCEMKFKKKAQLREHVNTAHYIDKLKAGYKTEYGRTKSSADDVKLPPLIPAAELDGDMPNMIGSNYGFGSDAMATSSPRRISPSQQLPSPNSISMSDSSHTPSMDSSLMSYPSIEDRSSTSSVTSTSPYMFPGFPFGGMPNLLPTLPQASGTSGCNSSTPSALQTAMASFFPFTNLNQPATASNNTTKQPDPTRLDQPGGQGEECPIESRDVYDPMNQRLETNDDVAVLKAAYQTEADSPVKLQVAQTSPQITAKPPTPSVSPLTKPHLIPLAPKQPSTPETLSPDTISPGPVNQTINDLTYESKSGSDSGFSSFNQSGNGPMSPQQASAGSFLNNLQAKSIVSDNPLSLLPKTSNAKAAEVSPKPGPTNSSMSLLKAPVDVPSNRLSPVHTTIGAILEAVEKRNKLQKITTDVAKPPAVNPFVGGKPSDPVPSQVLGMTSPVVPSPIATSMQTTSLSTNQISTTPTAVTSTQPVPLTSAVSAPVLAGLPLQNDPNANLPPGYMMMTLVVTSQPGGGISAVPLIPGYTYPMLPNQTITTTTPAVSGPGKPASNTSTLPASSLLSAAAVTMPTAVTTAATSLSSAIMPSSLINPAELLKNRTSNNNNVTTELEPGEINKNQPLKTGAVLEGLPPLIPAPDIVKHGMSNYRQLPLPPIPSTSKNTNVVSNIGNNTNALSSPMLYTGPNITAPILPSQQQQPLPDILPHKTSPRINNQGWPANQLLQSSAVLSPNFIYSQFQQVQQNNQNVNAQNVKGSPAMQSPMATAQAASMQSPMLAMSQMVNRSGGNISNMISNFEISSTEPSFMKNDLTSNDEESIKMQEDRVEQEDGVNRTSNKRKQSCPARTLHKLQKTGLDESMDIEDPEVLDLSAKTTTDQNVSDNIDNPDHRAKELERYISQDGGLDQSCSNPDATYQCDMCDVECENVYMLNKHKAKAHKAGLGLSKMVDRLWQTKKESKKQSSSRENSITPTLQVNDDIVTDGDKANTSREPVNAMDSTTAIKSVDMKVAPDALFSDTARQVYMEMMSSTLKSAEINLSPSNSGTGIPNVAGPLTVSECETNSGIFGHYRIKKPKMDDYCTFKFHTCKVCKQLFNTAEQMWDHALIHKELQRFKCSFKGCSYSSVSRERLIQHKVYVHQQGTEVKNLRTKTSEMDEFSLIGQQLHYPCEFEGCDSVFFLPGELVKHVDRVHQKLQCPEEGCTKSFYTMGGLKSHQMSHLEEVQSETRPQGTAGDGQTAAGGSVGEQQLKADYNSVIANPKPSTAPKKPLVCPLCKYAAQQRRSMNTHMKNRHGLDKVKTSHNRTVYVDGEGNMVCSFRTEYFTGGDYSESSSGGYESPQVPVVQKQTPYTTQLPPTPTPETATAAPLLDTAAPSSNVETSTDGFQIMKNEPEEITVGDNNTIATKDGTTIMSPPTQFTTELVYINNETSQDNDQPLDFSMKKPSASITRSTTASTTPPGNANNNSNIEGKESSGSIISSSGNSTENSSNKTPVGIVQPFMRIPSASTTPSVYASFLGNDGSGSINTGVGGNETPPLPQLVPMANPFTYIPQQHNMDSACVSHSNSPLPSSSSTPTSTGSSSDGQFFNFKLKTKRKRSSNTQKSDEPINYPCKDCGLLFDCAEAMWQHKLKDHSDVTKIYCDACGYDTMDQAELQSHMMCTHGKEVGDNKAFMCFICGKGYSSKLGLNHHLMRHSDGGPPQFPCPYRGCDSILHSRGALGNHVKRVHLKPSAKQTVIDESKQMFYCDYPRCDRSFRESKHLRVHRMTHTDEKPLKCHVCDYSCRQRNSMNWHMKSKHGQEKHVTVDGRTVYW